MYDTAMNRPYSPASSVDESFSIVDKDGRPKERWAPLGATSSPEPSSNSPRERKRDTFEDGRDEQELSKLLCENEGMNRALMALTSHFAQVQFRLGQALNTDTEHRDDMLQSLMQFASRGIPEFTWFTPAAKSSLDGTHSFTATPAIPPKPQKLIQELRQQLDDLERFAYETGEQKEPPTQAVLAKQRLVLEELTQRLELDINSVEELSNDQLKRVVDLAVQQFLIPVKVNEHLVEQLKTQIVDLERFVDLMHGSGACGEALIQALAEFKRTHQLCVSSSETTNQQINDNPDRQTATPGVQLGTSRHHFQASKCAQNKMQPGESGDEVPFFQNTHSNERTISLLHRAMAIMHIFTATNFGDVTSDWMSNLRQTTKHSSTDTSRNSATVERAKSQHWGAQRARFELAVNAVLDKVNLLQSFRQDMAAASSRAPSPTPSYSRRRLPNATYSESSTRVTSAGERSNASYWPTGDSENNTITLPIQTQSWSDTRTPVDRRLATSGRRQPEPVVRKNSRVSECSSYLYSGIRESSLSDTNEFLCAEAERMLVRVIRRQLCPALRDLIEHGLLKKSLTTIYEDPFSSIRPSTILLRPLLGCFSHRREDPVDEGFRVLDAGTENEDVVGGTWSMEARSRLRKSGLHAWHVLLKFYHMKNGQLYNQSPARRLSESFDLDSFGGKAITLRQRFFNAIGLVLDAHDAYKRSDDSKFKAFVSIAINEGKLVPWLRLVFKSLPLISTIYQPWSYTMSTGFDDALQSLSRIPKLDFNLPYDYSVRHLHEIRDAF